MARRANLLLAASLIVVLGLAACGRATPEDQSPAAATVVVAGAPTVVAAAVSPTVEPTAAPSPTPTEPAEVVPTPSATPSPTPVPEAQVATNGVPPRADVAFQTEAEKALTTVEVVKILRPSVVHIATRIDVGMGMFNRPGPEGPQGVGTGVVLDQDGHILTNNHVVEGAQQIIVTLSDNKSYEAVLIGTDPRTDIAVLLIDAPELTPAKLGVAAELEVGEDVIAIGHALGLPGGPTVSKGVVSALGRSIATDIRSTIVDLIQTDASINPGNSGGPLVNDRAEVVGINTAIIAGSQSIGFAINIDDVKVVAQQLMAKGYVERGYMGISPLNLTPAVISQTGIPLPGDVVEGILLITVAEGFPAEAAGLRFGDVIVEMGGQPIPNTGQLSKFLISHLPGETVEITYYRGPDRRTAELTLVEQPKSSR